MNHTDKIYVIKRGNCTFLTKALNVYASNASALVIVNNDNQLETPSSGIGIDASINISSIERNAVASLPVILVSNVSWRSLTSCSMYSSEANPCKVR